MTAIISCQRAPVGTECRHPRARDLLHQLPRLHVPDVCVGFVGRGEQPPVVAETDRGDLVALAPERPEQFPAAHFEYARRLSEVTDGEQPPVAAEARRARALRHRGDELSALRVPEISGAAVEAERGEQAAVGAERYVAYGAVAVRAVGHVVRPR